MARVLSGGTGTDWRSGTTSTGRAHSNKYKQAREYRSKSAAITALAIWLSVIAITQYALTLPLSADPGIDPANEVRGILVAVDTAIFTTDLAAPVSKVSYREGASFNKGEVLIAFDCRRQHAQLASMKAQRREMEVQLEGNLFLQRRGAVGKRDLESSRARAERAGHEARALEIRLERCVIKAPFDGRIRTLPIHEHEMPVAGKPILEILGTNEIELRLILPSLWLVWLSEGSKFTFNIDETGTQYEAKVRRIGAAVDPVSQTISVTGQLLGAAPEVRAGMSGTATFPNRGG